MSQFLSEKRHGIRFATLGAYNCASAVTSLTPPGRRAAFAFRHDAPRRVPTLAAISSVCSRTTRGVDVMVKDAVVDKLAGEHEHDQRIQRCCVDV